MIFPVARERFFFLTLENTLRKCVHLAHILISVLSSCNIRHRWASQKVLAYVALAVRFQSNRWFSDESDAYQDFCVNASSKLEQSRWWQRKRYNKKATDLIQKNKTMVASTLFDFFYYRTTIVIDSDRWDLNLVGNTPRESNRLTLKQNRSKVYWTNRLLI